MVVQISYGIGPFYGFEIAPGQLVQVQLEIGFASFECILIGPFIGDYEGQKREQGGLND